MRTVLFRILGTAHGLVGVISIVAAIYLVGSGDFPAVPEQYKRIGIASRIATSFGLVACGFATWFRPKLAARFAWGAAFAYCAPELWYLDTYGLASARNTFVECYYSAAVSALAALALMYLARPFGDGDKHSLKLTAAS